jgi:hypothetical protein
MDCSWCVMATIAPNECRSLKRNETRGTPCGELAAVAAAVGNGTATTAKMRAAG